MLNVFISPLILSSECSQAPCESSPGKVALANARLMQVEGKGDLSVKASIGCGKTGGAALTLNAQ